jgi:hypothetical protein
LYYRPEVFGILDDLAKAGKIRYYGVSVEKVEEALKAIEFPNVQAVQIIFNCFRQRPADLFFTRAKEKHVGILARVPLASGLLTGKFQANSTFAPDGHRNFNRHGESFDVGETFSGVYYPERSISEQLWVGELPESAKMVAKRRQALLLAGLPRLAPQAVVQQGEAEPVQPRLCGSQFLSDA